MGFALNLAESRPDPSPLPIRRAENTIDKFRFACNFAAAKIVLRCSFKDASKFRDGAENTIDKIRFACNFRGGQNRAPLLV